MLYGDKVYNYYKYIDNVDEATKEINKTRFKQDKESIIPNSKTMDRSYIEGLIFNMN